MTQQALNTLRKIIRPALRLLPVLFAVAVVVFLVRTRSGPVKRAAEEVGRPMRVIDAPVVAFRPRALGYGLAEPARVWQAMAEVKGVVVSVHPRLESGALIDAGAVLLRIDPAEYELALAQRKATLAETQAKLDELAAEEHSRRASMDIEKRSLAFARQSLERLRTLRQQKAVAIDAVDREERGVLQQEQAVQQLENAIALIPARRDALTAAMALHSAILRQAELDVAKTVVRAPFDCRLGDVKMEEGQVVHTGQMLFEAHGTDAVEIAATFRPEQLRDLLPFEKRRQFEPGITMEELQQLFELSVTIRLRSGDWVATWPARFDRIREAVDPRTRAISVVVVVEDPYGQIVPGVRPALVRGMHCEVELQVPPRPQVVVLPRSAVRNGSICLVDPEGRLRRQAVRIAFAQDDLVVLESGLAGGETVIVSDPVPAIEGMKVEAVIDRGLRERLIAQAEDRKSAR